jgi:hypothetical protein
MAKRHTFVAVGDNHGDMVDHSVSDRLFDFCKMFEPMHRIHLGDCFDFRSLRKGAVGKEENESLVDDVFAGKEFIKQFKPTVFLYGNHEDRLSQIIHTSSNGLKQDYCLELDSDIKRTLRENGCRKVYDYHADEGVHTLGPIKFVHGYTCGVNAVEEHAKHYCEPKGAIVMGHIHRIEQVCAKKHGGAVGFSGGCLCKKGEMAYAKNRLATSRWGNGWVYGFVEGKNWKIWQAHKVGSKFIYSHSDL